MWEAEGFVPSNSAQLEQGERRTLWRTYEDSVDWTRADQVARAIRVFESAILDTPDEYLIRLRRALAQDGWEIDDNRRIRRVDSPLRELSGIKGLKDPGGILDAFHRAELLIDQNPAGVVGASKELIEATAKTILSELGEAADSKADIPDLVAKVQKRLGLHPAGLEGPSAAVAASKKILGGASQIALGVNELRNKGGGAGHGQHAAPRLSPRHARLALNAARTWCELVLDTYTDERAPWRRPES